MGSFFKDEMPVSGKQFSANSINIGNIKIEPF